MNQLKINHPGVQETVQLNVEPGQTIELSFNPESASFERGGNDLNISFEDGSSVQLTDFFKAAEGGSLPTLVLEDGTQVEAGAFLVGINPDMDISTAAGPAAAAAANTGMSSYGDDAGQLLGGTDRLGSLDGPTGWSSKSTTADLLHNADGLAGAGGVTGGGTDSTAYVSRIVVHGANEVDTAKLAGFPAGMGIDPANDNGYFVIENGIIKLTAAGQQALDSMSGGAFKNILYLTDGVNSYPVQIVLVDRDSSDKTAFDSYDEDSASNNSHAPGHEWHYSDRWGSYDINSSSDNDKVLIEGTVLGGSSILTNGGAGDSVTVQVKNDLGIETVQNDTVIDTTNAEGKDGGKVTVESHTDGSWAVGAKTVDGSTTIKGSEVKVSGISDRSHANGMEAVSGAQNNLTATTGDVNVSATGAGWAFGVRTDKAFNNFNAAQDVRVGAEAKTGSAYGLDSDNSSASILDAGRDIIINAQSGTSGGSGSATGMRAQNGSSHELNADRDVSIEATSKGGSATGMSAMESSAQQDQMHSNNIIRADGDVGIYATGHGMTLGLYGQGNKETGHDIKAGKGIEVIATATGDDTTVEGIYANWTSSVNMQAGTNVRIEATGKGSGTSAVGVSGNNNTHIIATTGNIDVVADAGKNASGIIGGEYLAKNGKIHVDVDAGEGTASGVSAMGKTNTTLDAKEILIEVDSHGQHAQGNKSYATVGVHTADRSVTTITGDKVDIRVKTATDETSNANVHGVHVEFPGSYDNADKIDTRNIITGKEHVKIDATATGNSSAYGLYAKGFTYNHERLAENHIEGGYIEIKANAVAGGAVGMESVDYGAKNTLDSSGDILIAAHSQKNDAIGIQTMDNSSASITAQGHLQVNAQSDGDTKYSVGIKAAGGTNTVNAGSLTVQASGDKAWSYGVEAGPDGTNNIFVHGGELNVYSHGGAQAIGVFTESVNGNNNLTNETGKIYVEAKSNDFYAIGLKADKGSNILKGASVDIVAESTGSVASGLEVNSGGKNEIIADKVSVSAEADTSVTYGLTNHGGTNIITSSNVEINSINNSQQAFGMHAINSSNSVNIIQSAQDEPLILKIYTESGTGEKLYSMFAGSGGINKIIGNSVAGSEGDKIDLTGGLWSQGGAQNIIQTGHGNSEVTINGDLFSLVGSGHNIIQTGNGDSKVTINGNIEGAGNKVTTGSGDDTMHLNVTKAVDYNFTLQMGKGHDVLILQTIEGKFKAYFEDWIKSMLKGDHGIEAIQIAGGNEADIAWLKGMIDDYNKGKPEDKQIDFQTEDIATAFAAMALSTEDDSLGTAFANGHDEQQTNAQGLAGDHNSQHEPLENAGTSGEHVSAQMAAQPETMAGAQTAAHAESPVAEAVGSAVAQDVATGSTSLHEHDNLEVQSLSLDDSISLKAEEFSQLVHGETVDKILLDVTGDHGLQAQDTIPMPQATLEGNSLVQEQALPNLSQLFADMHSTDQQSLDTVLGKLGTNDPSGAQALHVQADDTSVQGTLEANGWVKLQDAQTVLYGNDQAEQVEIYVNADEMALHVHMIVG